MRLSVSQGKSLSVGSGTVIYSAADRSVILTCAHLFGESGPRVKVKVDLFGPEMERPIPPATGPGKLRYLESHPGRPIVVEPGLDVALVEFRPGRELDASPVARDGAALAVGQPVVTVGCSEGRDATVWSSRVVSLGAKVGDGKFTKCEFNPMQGRSGGGLFALDGHLIGVCDFGVQGVPLGLYAQPESIHRALAQAKLPLVETGWLVFAGGGRRSCGPEGCQQVQASPQATARPYVAPTAPFARRQAPAAAAPAPPEIPPVAIVAVTPPQGLSSIFAQLDAALPPWLGPAALVAAAGLCILMVPPRAQVANARHRATLAA